MLSLLGVVIGLRIADRPAVEPATRWDNATARPWVAAGVGRLGAMNYQPPKDAIYVATEGDDLAGDGTSRAPYRSIQRAVSAAPDGATVVVRGGVYHESVQWTGKRLTLQPYRDDQVWLSGSRPVSEWVAADGRWRAPGWTAVFDRQTPPEALDRSRPLAAWPEMVFRDGQQLEQVAAADQVDADSFYVDLPGRALIIGGDPTGHRLEAADLERALTLRDAAGSVVRGLGFRRYATSFHQVAAVVGFSDGLTFDRDVFEDNAIAGLSMIKSNDLKVTRSAMRGNGQMGLHAHRVRGLLVAGNWLDHNNVAGFEWQFAQGGMKITEGHDMTWTGNLASDNEGDGMWCDINCTNVSIVRNVLLDNQGRGVKYEISADGVIASNVAKGNAGGVLVNESSDVAVYNNFVSGSRIGILALEGSRHRDVPTVPHDLLRLQVRNNVLVSSPDGRPSVAVRGLPGPVQQEQVDADFDVYVRGRDSHTPLVEFPGEGGAPKRMGAIDRIRRGGQEQHGRTTATMVPSTGARLTSTVAQALDVPTGRAVSPGPLGRVPDPGSLGSGLPADVP